MIRIGTVFLVTLVLASAGCQRNYRQYATKLSSSLAAGDYAGAAAAAEGAAAKSGNGDSTRILYLLEAGRTAQLAGDYDTSSRRFAEANELMRPFLDTKAEASITEGVATTAVNQSIARYLGRPSDRVLACALNACSLMAKGDFDTARVELNLGKDWQEDARIRYAREIEKLDRQAREEEQEAGIDRSSVMHEVRPHFEQIERMVGYSSYANPFLDHLRGVFYLTCGLDEGDRGAAESAFRAVLNVNPDLARFVSGDLDLVRGRNPSANGTTWVYFLTGFAPWYEELRLDIPIPIGDVNYVSAAFPIMKFDEQAVGALEVAGGGRREQTTVLADVDRICASEFKSRLPAIIMQEVASSALKATATYAAKKNAGVLGQIGGIVFQAASTSADLRSWRSAPKRIGVCRIPTPTDGAISLRAGGATTSTRVDAGSSNVVLVSLPNANGRGMAVTTIRMSAP